MTTSKTLIAQLARIFQTALELHERLELAHHRSPVLRLSEALGLDPMVVPIEHVATTLFGYLVFGQPSLCRTQTLLQDQLLETLGWEDRLIFRQLRTEPLRAWRYLPQPASRDVAAQLCGPEAGREEFFDGLIDLASGALAPRGGACLGWPLQTSSEHLLIGCAMLGPEAEDAIESIAPFPMPRDERDFWSEQLVDILALAIDPLALIRPEEATRIARAEAVDPTSFRDGARIVLYAATQPQELLERVLVGADFELVARGSTWYSPTLRRIRHTRETIARARTADDLEPLRQALTELRYRLAGATIRARYESADDPALDQWLPMTRILDGFGISPDATMPAAESRAVQSQPMGLLLLEPDHPVYADVHVREPIRQALDWARKHPGEPADTVTQAFACYLDERRWLATFARLDLSLDSHLERVDYATLHHALVELFDPRAARATLESLGLDARYVGSLEAALRPKPYTDDNVLTVADLPPTRDGVRALRNVGKSALDALKRALFEHATGWRADQLGIDPRGLDTRVASQARSAALDETLGDGLDELAKLFGD